MAFIRGPGPVMGTYDDGDVGCAVCQAVYGVGNHRLAGAKNSEVNFNPERIRFMISPIHVTLRIYFSGTFAVSPATLFSDRIICFISDFLAS